MSTVAYARILREQMEEANSSVESGLLKGVQTWDEYNIAVGRRRGLLQALEMLDETTRRFDQAED
jgi:hypothetical protein